MTPLFSGGAKSGNMLQRASLVVVLMAVLSIGGCHGKKDTSRSLQVINDSGVKINLYWINRWKNDELVLNSADGVLHGANSAINTYVGHEFEIIEQPSKKTGTCREEECMTATFQVNENYGQIVTVNKGLELKLEDDKTKAHAQAGAMVQECKAQFADKEGDPYELLEELTSCIQNSVNVSLEEKMEELEFQGKIKSSLGGRLAAYACADDKLNTTKSLENVTFTFENKRRPVRVLFDRPASKIHLIENFITPEECEAIVALIPTERVDANGLLANKGGVSFSSDVWGDKKDVVDKVLARIHKYAQDSLEFALQVEGREDLFLLHYEGRGADDASPPDHYDAHCDGTCDGSSVKQGDRIATIIMYCALPSKGGATNFPNAGVHVKPNVGDALYYSYVDSETGHMDTGMTNHSGCPVVEGEKKILTHKFRTAG